MIIRIKLSRDEAHRLNALIISGINVGRNIGRLDREDHFAVASWNAAYTREIQKEGS